MATYKEIQKWVHKKYGWKPETCHIAHCKELKGLPTGRAWNRDGDRKKTCQDALKHMIGCSSRLRH